MNIILLSGGSGKQLWPLSNDVRSKQFVRLFRNESGKYESMLQRVYRQIIMVDKNARITVATTPEQVGVIKHQLGDTVKICVEPSRRDTFAAIALSLAYLHDKLGVSENEIIIVCPVDFFVEDDFYKEVKKLEEIVLEKVNDVVLMGIQQVCPSNKYGHIIPEVFDRVSKVKKFKEKVSMEEANKYFMHGALWNAGVFAFKLGNMLGKLQRMIGSRKYNELFSNFNGLPRASFDYMVVREAKNVWVMRCACEWADLGDWNVITEYMSDNVRGNAMLDDICENTYVINEIGIPVLCMGGKNKIIAASSDGILVLDKKFEPDVKRYVEKINENIRYAEKSWGTYTVIDAQPGSIVVRLGLQAGKRMKYHSHELRDEAWTITSGFGKCIVDGMEQFVRPGDVISVAAGCKHVLIAETDMNIIEVQTGTEISQDDKKVFDIND